MERKSYVIMFSPGVMGFYPRAWIDDGSILVVPDDLVELTRDEVSEYRDGMPPTGKILGVKKSRPAWVDIPAEQVIDGNISERARLRAIADSEIAWRQDAVDAGVATDEEAADLAAWKKYRVLLMRIDTAAPVWPTPPAQ